MNSRKVWDNGKFGDARIELWADRGNAHVWAETNGAPVFARDDLVALLTSEGVPEADAQAAADGELAAFTYGRP